jgi:dTDP-4-dehydrorhamnose reductase
VKILVLGVSGMLGNAMFRVLSESSEHEVWGTARSPSVQKHYGAALASRVEAGIDVENPDSLASVLERIRPDVVVNCIGLVKQFAQAGDPLQALPINAMLPHRLARYCALLDARLVHISTDCVFNGARGTYGETDISDAEDLYGKSKFIGEVAYPHTITLRTSIIGHELASHHGLIEWFLSQTGTVHGYRRVVFSGLPTVELSRIVRDAVLPRPALNGVFHVASAPITKYDLLKLVAQAYGKTIEIVPDDSMAIDRTLIADRFRLATGYVAPAWPDLVQLMKNFR